MYTSDADKIVRVLWAPYKRQAEEDANHKTTKAAHSKRHFPPFLPHTPAIKLEADFNPSMTNLLARPRD